MLTDLAAFALPLAEPLALGTDVVAQHGTEDEIILGADDSIPNDSDPERVRALVDYVHSWRQTHQN